MASSNGATYSSVPQRPEGVAVSPFVASLISEIDGHRNVRHIVERIASRASGQLDEDGVAQAVLSTLKILTVDGLIENQSRRKPRI